jgi:hypothetical protein
MYVQSGLEQLIQAKKGWDNPMRYTISSDNYNQAVYTYAR